MDQRIYGILDREVDRQATTIELIASENFASDSVRALAGSVFTNKYAEGYPGNRYYNGCEHMDEIETLAIEELKKLYGCEFANVQPHCGANANTAVYQAFLKPGDKILGMDLASGGHLSHGSPPNISGKIYEAHTYGVDEITGLIDYSALMAQAKLVQPKMIIAGASAYPRSIDWSLFREIADSVGAMLLVDMAHYSGLIAGGVFPSPIHYADVVTSTTHKTLRGPRGGIILWNNSDYSKRINSAIFPGTQGGPLMHIIAAKAQCFIEANTQEFKDYSQAVVQNAKAMCRVLLEHGMEVQTNGTDSHIILMDLSTSKHSGRQAADLLEANGITVNKNGVPNDPRSFIETSGIRIGTAAETTRGHDEEWFKELALKIVNILK
ncbi:MAG: serine hydroxymethyltransferase [Methylophagaceae bacterium]|jgi:glycine hydroxymethyltransferase|tara:strand:- start:436 stop:1578 length:1143 start_codon:yes stop_codon:yes gene_type:complete